ncbi:MAG: CoA transferase [Dehalococcoidia bacterium]|nr:CoA transferase [Dehalococcoidia bacterium]
MAGALEGIRVIDFSQGTAGPYAGMLLAEQGADVVKVEPPAGDRARGRPAFHVLNRSKRGIVLDLTERADRRLARQLAATADAVIIDLLPKQTRPLGIDYRRLSAANPSLVYCAMPLYGSRGPWADLPPDDALLAAVSGISGAQWSYRDNPVYLVTPIASYAAGILAAGAIAATLFDRYRSGRGDYIEVSGLGGAFALQTSSYVLPLGAIEIMRLAGRGDPRGPFPTYRVYRAADGEWLMLGALTPPFWAKFALAAGLEEYLADPRFEGAPVGIPVPEDRQELSSRIESIFASRPRRHWLDLLEAADVPVAPVATRDDFLNDPQTIHNGMRAEIVDPEVGPTVQIGVPLRMEGSAIRGPAPLLGQHTREVLDALASHAPGALPMSASPSRDGAAPLEGVTVLDLGTIYAGPYNAMLLSDLGANVIKIESPDGDPWRVFGLGFLGVNRGKRGLALDLKSDEGKALFYDLVRKADVVTDNFRAGVLKRLGIDYETLSAINPRIICCSSTPFGSSGPMAGRPGFDPLLQARSGLMRAQGGEGEEPVYHQIAVCDFVGALVAAYGVAAALYARERTGRGQLIETSLAAAAMAAQAGEFIRYEGRPADPPGGPDLLGVSAVYRAYQCSDGWLFLAVSTEAQAEALGMQAGAALPAGTGHNARNLLDAPLHGEVAAGLERFFSMRCRQEAVKDLVAAGVPSAPCLAIGDLFDDGHLKANDLWWETEHPVNGPVRQTGRIVKWKRHRMRLERPAPLLGQHSREVLLAFGIDRGRIEDLISRRVVIAGADIAADP